jgi:uncharacterized membrane protein
VSVPEPRHEHRWPTLLAVVSALLLYVFLPGSVLPVPVWIMPALCLALLVPLLVLNPRRLSVETTWSRAFSLTIAVLLTVGNQVTLGLTIAALLRGQAAGAQVLLTTLQVWATNALAFALVYWELDRGGPVARRTVGLRDQAAADFRFPQDGDPEPRSWAPEFVDYAYFSLTNMMAFSPTDVMPLTSRAKGLMAYQAVTAFILLALVISRAVNILT